MLIFPLASNNPFKCSINIDVLGDKITSQGPQLTRPPYNGALLDSRFNDNGHHGAVTPLMGSGSRTPAGDDWELDCEVCHRHGVNLVSAPRPGCSYLGTDNLTRMTAPP